MRFATFRRKKKAMFPILLSVLYYLPTEVVDNKDRNNNSNINKNMSKRGITYIKQEEPNFLKKFKEQVTCSGENT